jgi:putative spermidine/putrescine transport system ATP-binding protein
MSDRLAVFSDGRIEQIGEPVEVYERPATDFVAGFVGVSNVLERDGRRFTIRPEKIHLGTNPGSPLEASPGEQTGAPSAPLGEPGVVQEVQYVGAVTRYVVQLDSGERLVVVRQNLESSPVERDARVRLHWRPEHTYEIDKEGT